MNRFIRLHLEDWQQFRGIDIDFHDRLTIVTGANGSGKTTILSLLARHCNWDIPLIAMPKKDKKRGLFSWVTGNDKDDPERTNIRVGQIQYGNRQVADLYRPTVAGAAQFNLQIHNQQLVEGFFIPSHRSVYSYQKLTNLPTSIEALTKAHAFQKVSSAARERYFGGSSERVNYHMKEILVAWSTFGHGNPTMDGTPYLLECYRGFEEVLRKLLPSNLGFNRIVIQNFEVVLDCDSGSFLIDAASGGLTALIDMAWQIFMFSEDKEKHFTVLIDEVENHLHPTMQRRILSDLLSAFPNLTFIVTTHSPLIVSSVKDSNVYALRYAEDRKVYSEKLDLVKNAKTASEVLDSVLGVSTTLPLWAEQDLNRIIKDFSVKAINKKNMNDLKSSLDEAGLGDFVPEAVEGIAESAKDGPPN